MGHFMLEELNRLQKEYEGLAVENVKTIDEMVRYIALTGFLVASQTIMIYANKEERETIYRKLCEMNSSLPYSGGIKTRSSSSIEYDSRTFVILSTKRKNYTLRGIKTNAIFVVGNIPEHWNTDFSIQQYYGAAIIQIGE